jgi:hypothetical protein
MLKYLLRNHMIELDHWKIDKLVIYNQIGYNGIQAQVSP